MQPLNQNQPKNRSFFIDPPEKGKPLFVPFLKADPPNLKLDNIFFISENSIIEKINIKLYEQMLLFSSKEVSYKIKFKQVYFEEWKGDSQFPFGFTLRKNQDEVTIMTKDILTFEKWKQQLKSQLISHDFHEQYDVKKMIGKGHFAKVYFALKRSTLEKFAIKAFSKDYILSQRDGQKSIINEINIMHKLNHKHCLHLYQVYETENSLYFVIDLIEGGELIKHIQSNKNSITEREIRVIVRNILSAVNHCHQNKIMHRDIKPDNILVKSSENIFDIILADFGLSTKIPKTINQVLFTRCGTPGYVAPEVLRWKAIKPFYDCKCDVFSIGCIFYLMAAGKKAFKGTKQDEVLKLNRKCEIDFKCCEHLSDQALDLLKKMLVEDPLDRISSQDALWHPFVCNDLEDLDDINEFENDFEIVIPIIDSKVSNEATLVDSNGSFHQRQVLFNGRVDTLDNLMEKNLIKCMSPVKKQSSYGRKKMAEEFKKAADAKQQNNEQEQQIIETLSNNSNNNINMNIPNTKIQNEMHRMAIMNNIIKDNNMQLRLNQKSTSFKLLKKIQQQHSVSPLKEKKAKESIS